MKSRVLAVVLIVVLIAGAAGAKRVACVGDSITYGSGIADRANDSYPAQLEQILKQYDTAWEVDNFGVSGATLLSHGDLPYVRQSAYSNALASNPDIVIIKLGTNDSKPHNWVYRDEYVSDYVAMVDAFRALPVAWLGMDTATGALMTGIRDGGRFTNPLVSEVDIADGNWHDIRLVWDGARRYLYVDGQEAIADTRDLGTLKSSRDDFFLGVGEDLTPGTFFSGLIDEFRFYNVALKPVEASADPPGTSD